MRRPPDALRRPIASVLHTESFPSSGVPEANVVVQRANRDTGRGMRLSLLMPPRHGVAVFPSDHYVGNGSALVRCAQRAARLLLIFGVGHALGLLRRERPEETATMERARSLVVRRAAVGATGPPPS